MSVHLLKPHHHAHLNAIGVPKARMPYIHCSLEEYNAAYDTWKLTHPDATHEFLHMKALGHIAWAQHSAGQEKKQALAHHDREIKFLKWVVGFLVLALLLAIARPAHAQFSKINFIDIKNQGSDIGFFTSPFTVNFTGAGVSCANSAGVVTCTVTGGSITNNPGGVSTNVQYNNGGVFGGIANGTLGQVLISQGAGSTPAFADPLVQGTQAAASTTIPNPVVIGGSDYGGTAAVQTAKVTSAGALQTHETGTAAISAASLPLPSGAAPDSSLTTIDTDVKANITLHAGTNVIGHVIDDAGSTTAVTGNVAVTKADGSDVTFGAKADAKSTATDTTAITAMQVLKEISAMEQAPASRAVTNAGTFAVQAADSIADGADTTLGAKADAKSTATDTTAVSAISVLKEISALEQAPASRAVTNAGTFAVQAAQSGTWTVQPGNTANTTAWKVDGSAVTQPVSCASGATCPVNATLSAETTKVIGTVRAQGNLGAAFDAATGAAPPANAVLAGGLGSGATGGDVIAIPVGDTYKNINISTATTTLLVTGVASRQVRITALHMVTALANNVALIEGTGATCGTGTAGMAGGTTAASGYNLAANGGMTLGSGLGTVLQTATTGDSVCAVTSAATQLSGGLEYAIY